MIELTFADRDLINNMAATYHYMHSRVHYRANPFGYLVRFDEREIMPDGRPAGFIIFASIHFTRQRGIFGYPGLPTKWQVLSLARLWIHPDLQSGGRLCLPELVPGFTDRKGTWRPAVATTIIKQAIAPDCDTNISRVGFDWLQVHPPRYPDQPYHIRLINSYADKTHGHEGTIYQQAGFERIGEVQSEKRHENTRGRGMDGHILIQYIYHLPEPDLSLEQIPGQLFLPFVVQAVGQ